MRLREMPPPAGRIYDVGVYGLYARKGRDVADFLLPQTEPSRHPSYTVTVLGKGKQVGGFGGIGVEIEQLAVIDGTEGELPSVGCDDSSPGGGLQEIQLMDALWRHRVRGRCRSEVAIADSIVLDEDIVVAEVGMAT